MDSIFNREYEQLALYICIPIIIGILTIGLPLIIQIINRIDDKYKSTIIVDFFYKSWQYLFFVSNLILSVILLFVYTFSLDSITFSDFKLVQSIIDNSAIILLILSTIILLISLYLIILLEKKYNNSYSLAKHLREKEIYFKGISELFFHAIKTENEDLSRNLLEIIYGKFIKYKDGKQNQYISYPQSYYDLILRGNEFICLRGNKRLSSVLNGSTMVNCLIEDYQQTRLSNDTYSCIWRCIRQSLFYPNNDNLAQSYWNKAHQHFVFYLKSNYNNNYNLINQNEVDERERERGRFLEFHYVLGALFLYSDKYDILNYIFNYSNQRSPLPVFKLVPNSFNDLFDIYLTFQDDLGNFGYYQQNYPFPESNNLDEDNIILSWIDRYFAILFIRQYGVHNNYQSNPYKIVLPPLPKSLKDCNALKQKIESLKYWVEFYITKDSNTLKKLDLASILESTELTKRGQKNPIIVLNDYIKNIETEYKKIKSKRPLSETKIQNFNTECIEIIKNHLIPILDLKLQDQTYVKDVDLEMSSYIGLPNYQILEKGAFSEEQDTSYLNALSITAQGTTMLIDHYFTISFSVVRNKKRYLISFEQLFQAIDKLNIDSNYVIVSMGFGLNHNIQNYEPLGLEVKDGKFTYKGIEIVEIGFSQMESLNRAFYIIKKDDLPSFTIHELKKETIEKYEYQLVDNDYKIYTSVIDLNKNETIQEEVSKNYRGSDNLKEKVLVCLGIKYELRWSKHAKYIQIKEFDTFRENGKLNNLDDIGRIA